MKLTQDDARTVYVQIGISLERKGREQDTDNRHGARYMLLAVSHFRADEVAALGNRNIGQEKLRPSLTLFARLIVPRVFLAR